MVTDHDTCKVVWIGKGKSADALEGFFEVLPERVVKGIEIVNSDMSQAYQQAAGGNQPNATLANHGTGAEELSWWGLADECS